MLVTLANMKSYLGITSGTYDTFLTEQLNLISDTVEAYCRRIFSQGSYTQLWYNDHDGEKANLKKMLPFHFPLITVTSLKIDGVLLDTDEYRIHKPTGEIKVIAPPADWDEVELIYSAGFATIPTPIDAVVKQLVSERYNKKISGVQLNFGSDVQRVSIPGTISIDFDYSLDNNKKESTFGTILGSYVNSLNFYRSERVAGVIKENEFVS